MNDSVRARYEFCCVVCKTVLASGWGVYAPEHLDKDEVHREAVELCDCCEHRLLGRLWLLWERVRTGGARMRQRMIRGYCEVVGGSRYTFRERVGGRDPAPKWFWLNAWTCRRLRHCLDGSEMGTGGGEYVDLWCSRCFYFYRPLHVSEVPFLHDKIETYLGWMGRVPDQQKMLH